MALFIPPEVAAQLTKLPKANAKGVIAALVLVAANLSVRFPFVTEIVGEIGVWRLRRGEWRAVYRIADGDVVVDRIARRGEVYRRWTQSRRWRKRRTP